MSEISLRADRISTGVSRSVLRSVRRTVMPSTFALMPTLAKNTGVSSRKLNGSNLDWI